MRIGFTGHRDRRTDESELDRIAALYPGATWVHGGAEGFDTQVDEYAKAHGLPEPDVIRPEYDKYDWWVAPIMRNYVIVDTTVSMVACWDRRRNGGTYRTVEYALEKGKVIDYVTCRGVKPAGDRVDKS